MIEEKTSIKALRMKIGREGRTTHKTGVPSNADVTGRGVAEFHGRWRIDKRFYDVNIENPRSVRSGVCSKGEPYFCLLCLFRGYFVEFRQPWSMKNTLRAAYT